MEYRGIQLDESVKLYRKNGEYNKKIKKSLDTFANALEEENYKCIGTYRTSHIKVDLQCDKGHVISMISNDFNRGIRCRKCYGNDPEQAKEAFFKKIEADKHICLSNYLGYNEKILIDFDCGHEAYWTTPHEYKYKHNGCPKCGIIRIAEKHSAQAKAEFPSIVQNRGHRLLSEYKNSKIKVLIDFNCNHEPHWIEPHAYKEQKGCPKCAYVRVSFLRSAPFREEFPLFVESKGHTLLTPYGKKNTDKVLIDFKCNHEPHWITPHDYKQGYGCPDCGREKTNKAQKIKSQKAKKEFSKIVKTNGDKLLTPYKANHEKVLIGFNCKHGPHWITPAHYKSGKSCPSCSESKGEKIIRKWLEVNKIKHFPQYKFPSKNMRKAFKYDFMLSEYNLIIEVHGIQHYEFKERFHKTNKDFIKQQKNDRKKRQYAEKLGYKYIEVDYREHKPELALERFLEVFNELRRNESQDNEQLVLF